MSDFDNVLNGGNVDLSNTIARFFRAIATEYFSRIIERVWEQLTEGISKGQLIPPLPKLSLDKNNSMIDTIFNEIYEHTEATDELIDLVQNISTAVDIIEQVNLKAYCYKL